MEKVILANSGLLWLWVQKTGYCPTILLSSAKTAISYFEPLNCKVQFMVHCSMMCNSLYGSLSFVCLSGADALYCLRFGLPPQCGERSCRDCYILTGIKLPLFIIILVKMSHPPAEHAWFVSHHQLKFGIKVKNVVCEQKKISHHSVQATLNPITHLLSYI